MRINSTQGRLVCVGTGMTLGAHITPRARNIIEKSDVVFVAVSDGIVEKWIEEMNTDVRSLQVYYQEGISRNITYKKMQQAMLTEVRNGKNVCGAFYGHPGVFAMAPHKSIEQAKERAKDAGLNNVSFEVATAKDYPGNDYDLIAFFDCLHDMGDPVGACSHAKKALKSDGTCMIVEPFANDSLDENLNPVGRAFYTFSTMICTPCSLNQEVGLALGAQAGEKRLKETITTGGFNHFRRATETPFNLILEARP